MAHLEVMKYCVRNWLSSVKQRTMAVEDLSERIRRIESALTLKGVNFDKLNTTPSSDSTISDGLAKLQELHTEWNDKVDECIDYFKEAYALCGPEFPNRYVVWLHDYEGMIWDAVAVRVHYAKSTTRNMALVGYMEIYNVMPGEWKSVIPKSI